jgi:hypothetical protein
MVCNAVFESSGEDPTRVKKFLRKGKSFQATGALDIIDIQAAIESLYDLEYEKLASAWKALTRKQRLDITKGIEVLPRKRGERLVLSIFLTGLTSR